MQNKIFILLFLISNLSLSLIVTDVSYSSQKQQEKTVTKSSEILADTLVKKQSNTNGHSEFNFLKWITSSTASALSFLLNIIMFLLAIFGFISYYRQKREYALLQAVMQQYKITKKLKAQKKKAQQEVNYLQDVKDETVAELTEAKQDLKISLPLEARRVYYENSIPIIEEQIFELEKQLRNMTNDLVIINRHKGEISPVITKILSKEVKKRLTLKTNIENARTSLAVFAAIAAGVAIMVPFPFNILATPLGFVVLNQAIILYKLNKQYKEDFGINQEGVIDTIFDRILKLFSIRRN